MRWQSGVGASCASDTPMGAAAATSSVAVRRRERRVNSIAPTLRGLS